MSETAWFCVRIRSNQRTVSGAAYADPSTAPFITELQLQRRGFETFLPRRTVYRHANGVTAKQRKKREVARPLLVGWIFVGWPDGQNRWRDLFDCPGVVGVAGAEGKPARVQEAALRAFAKRFGGGLVTAHERERFMRSRAEYSPGDTVRLLAEPMAGLTGRVVAVNKRQAQILLPLFGERAVWMDAALVEPIEKAA